MNPIGILLQAAPEGGAGGLGDPSFLIMMGLVVLVMWLFMIRPQAKKAKEVKKFRAGIDKGQRVVTVGGIHGKIVGVQDSTVMIEVEGGNRLKIEKSAISMEYTSGTGEGELTENPAAQKK